MRNIRQYMIYTSIFFLSLLLISSLIGWYLGYRIVNVAFIIGAIALLISTSGLSTEAHLAMKTLGSHVPKEGSKLLTFNPLLLSSLLLLVISFLYALIT
ncbi:hypothetical protein N0O92_15275 [Alkalihalobacillus sp. MEB130]|uniref:hypothetical protein n=1 Tax=Alkalihalobacillus sp. MEB130 TaxID=2976704 RepID=UPI0028E019FA|nr:hypothetical protein [Alkalihalobacillus sp. MEB130]MDT8861578.1 hypothetical protein [Alkalihalobacillus sp. MEB130]